MKNGKLSFDELSKKAKKLSNEEQLKMLGGRRGRGGNVTWTTTRGGIIDDDLIIRITPRTTSTGRG